MSDIDSDTDGRRLATARHYLGISRPEAALAQLAECSSDAHQEPVWHALRAAALMSSDEHEAALEAARLGLETSPEHGALHEISAECLMRLGDYKRAETHVLEALRGAPEDPDALCLYAMVLLYAGRNEKARRLVEVAASIDPEEPGVFRARWFLDYIEGRGGSLANHAADLARIEPNGLSTRVLLAYTAEEGGRRGDARRLMASAAADAPADHDLARMARARRVASHPLLWPVRPFDRLGVAGSWLVGLGGAAGLRAFGYERAATVWILAYIGLAVYSWIVPPLVTRAIMGRDRDRKRQ